MKHGVSNNDLNICIGHVSFVERWTLGIMSPWVLYTELNICIGHVSFVQRWTLSIHSCHLVLSEIQSKVIVCTLLV